MMIGWDDKRQAQTEDGRRRTAQTEEALEGCQNTVIDSRTCQAGE